ncbi:MAG TPA: hypothetical protein VNO86_03930 [Candidatus Binatia bacterium]|nr:hypothetical protein [Candidatus Binatia bacterium]
MHGQARQTGPRPTSTLRPGGTPYAGLRRGGAITWVDRRRAIVVKTAPDGTVEVERVERDVPGDGRTYLARVVHDIGDEERVVVVGPWPDRTALERAYTAVVQRPDRLVDVEPTGPLASDALMGAALDEPALVERLRRLAEERGDA